MSGITIIICTFNGAERLPFTLKALTLVDFTEAWEVLVVDNASTDLTVQLVSQFLEEYPSFPCRIISEFTPGLSAARSTGWKAAVFPIVLFCDDDNWLESDYLKRGYSHFVQNPNLGVLGGCGEPVSLVSFPAWFAEFSHSYAVGNNSKSSGVQKFGSAHYGAGCFFLKQALEEIGSKGVCLALSDRKGKKLVSGGDVELCFLVQLLGYDISFDEDLRFKHFIAPNRLDWQYYLRLKKGIASSFPILNAYKVFFEGKPTISFLRKMNNRQFWTALKGVVLCSFRSISKPSKRNEIQLLESKTKVISFLRNRKTSEEQFRILLSKLS